MNTSNVMFPIEVLDSSKGEQNKNDEKLLKTFFPRGIIYIGKIINFISLLSADLSSRLTMLMFSISISKPLRQKDAEFYDQGIKRCFRHGKYRFNVYEYGQGPYVLLVHGWTCNGARWKRYVDRVVSEGYTALVMDAPAHGTSPGWSLPVPQFVLCVQKVINTYGGVDSIVSHSMGSIVSAIALSRSNYSTCTSKLTLMNTFADCDSLISRFASCIGINDNVMSHTREWITKYTYSPLSYFSLIDHLSDLKVEVLFISDVEDIVVPQFEVNKILSSEYPIEFVQTSGLGHRLRSEEVVDKVLSHLTKKAESQFSFWSK